MWRGRATRTGATREWVDHTATEYDHISSCCAYKGMPSRQGSARCLRLVATLFVWLGEAMLRAPAEIDMKHGGHSRAARSRVNGGHSMVGTAWWAQHGGHSRAARSRVNVIRLKQHILCQCLGVSPPVQPVHVNRCGGDTVGFRGRW
jgi:hypothetical protein